jgi:hypothetical protein
VAFVGLGALGSQVFMNLALRISSRGSRQSSHHSCPRPPVLGHKTRIQADAGQDNQGFDKHTYNGLPVLNWLYLVCWLTCVLVLSAVIALFEVVLEKNQGWASGFERRWMGRQLFHHGILLALIEKPYITVYHLLMFGGIVPLILAAECLLIRFFWVSHIFAIRGSVLLTVWQVGSVRFLPWFSGIAAWLAICVIEDFLWFVFNWYYPASLHDLLSGNIWWHTRWVQVGRLKVPRFYLSTMLLVCALWSLSVYITG